MVPELAFMLENGSQKSESKPQAGDLAPRRTLLKLAIAAGLAVFPCRLLKANEPEDLTKLRPRPGDRFVYFSGEKKGAEIKPDDLERDAPQVLAWPMDPQTGTVRDGSLLNQILLIRLNSTEIDEATLPHTADGIIGYSAICTHAQCPVTGWNNDKKLFHCQCHQSEYDPRQDGQVISGPAPRALPLLPLKIEDGVLIAGGPFRGRVGTKTT
jgi:rieske iron-sulfur protein